MLVMILLPLKLAQNAVGPFVSVFSFEVANCCSVLVYFLLFLSVLVACFLSSLGSFSSILFFSAPGTSCAACSSWFSASPFSFGIVYLSFFFRSGSSTTLRISSMFSSLPWFVRDLSSVNFLQASLCSGGFFHESSLAWVCTLLRSSPLPCLHFRCSRLF